MYMDERVFTCLPKRTLRPRVRHNWVAAIVNAHARKEGIFVLLQWSFWEAVYHVLVLPSLMWVGIFALY